MPVRRLKEFLDSNGVKYATVTHSRAYTAQEVAQSAHIPGREMAKPVMLRLDGRLVMAVLPATHRVDLTMLRAATGSKDVELVAEPEFMPLFPECESGAMPPFGNLYGMDMLVDSHLREDEEIGFNAGTHTELMLLAYRDFERLTHPTVAKFTAGS